MRPHSSSDACVCTRTQQEAHRRPETNLHVVLVDAAARVPDHAIVATLRQAHGLGMRCLVRLRRALALALRVPVHHLSRHACVSVMCVCVCVLACVRARECCLVCGCARKTTQHTHTHTHTHTHSAHTVCACVCAIYAPSAWAQAQTAPSLPACLTTCPGKRPRTLGARSPSL